MMARSLLLALLSSPVMIPAAAAEPQFSMPVACSIGKDCFVQNYVDTDPSTGAKDFACGGLTYDGHKGTDIRLRTYVEMDRGVDVLAAAPGTVLRIRDGMDDVSIRVGGVAAIKNREAGNGVIIDHGDGWVTQYAHMKKGSVAVKPGQQVAAGDRLGEVGLSGDTEFPHLHFEVRHNDRPVDPFTDETIGAGCGVMDHPLWRPEIAKAMGYLPSGLLASGFALGRADYEAAEHGAYAKVAMSGDSPALVFWIDAFGLQAGDQITLRLVGPDHAVIAESTQPMNRAKAHYFAFAGGKRPPAGWLPGTYRGVFAVLRAGKNAIEESAEITLQ
jgi:hypothetical protein